MGRISQYPLDTDIQGNDKWIGTSVNTANATKNFSVDKVIEYLNKTAGTDSQNLRYTYQNADNDAVRLATTISFPTPLGDNVPFSGITEWIISAFAKPIKDVRTYYDAPFVTSTILITHATNPSNWAIFRWNSVTEDIDNPDFYTIGLTHIDSAGGLEVNEDYLVALLDYGSGSGSAYWGGITGTLSDQTDLQTALNGKQPTLISGTNIKTINGTSLLGSGDITITTSTSWGSITGTLSSQTDLQNALNAKYNVPTGTVSDYIDGTGAIQPFPTLLSADKMVTVGRNATGATLYKGTIVYISGSTGNRPNFVKALANSEGSSAGTFGVIESDIANNADGNCVTIGTLGTLDTRSTAPHPFTNDTLADGDTIYLSPTVAGYITNVKPSAPNHLVYIGKVVRTSPTLGTIVYRIQNGYELAELHDVAALSPSNGDLIQYNSSNFLWEKKSLSGAGIQPTLVSGTNIKTINSTSLLGSGDIVISASPSGVAGAVQFSNGSAFASDAANLFWDDTNNRLGIGTNIPNSNLVVVGSGGDIVRIMSADGTKNTFFTNSGLFGVQVYPLAAIHSSGSGTTSATSSLISQNSTNTASFKVGDDGVSTFAFPTGGKVYITGAVGPGEALLEARRTSGTLGGIILRSDGGGGSVASINGALDLFSTTGTDIGLYATTGVIKLATGVKDMTAFNTGHQIKLGGQNSGSVARWVNYGWSPTYGNNFQGVQNASTPAIDTLSLNPFGGNVGVGAILPTAILHTKGTGTTNATSSFKAENSNATKSLVYNDSGQLIINYGGATTTIDGFNIYTYNIYAPNGASRIQLDGGAMTLIDSAGQSNIVAQNNQTYILKPLKLQALGTLVVPNASAILDMESTTKGALLPRMTTSQKNAITTPATGLIVYDTDLLSFYQYNGTAWTIVGGGSGSPSGAVNSIQFNDGGVFNGATNLTVDNGDLTILKDPTPTAPAANNLKIFAEDFSGRMMPAVILPDGFDYPLQGQLGHNKVSYWAGIAGATTNTGTGIALQATGTATAATWAATNLHTSMNRLAFAVATAAATAVGGFRGGAQNFWRGNAAGLGGFTYIARFSTGIYALTAANRCFVGLRASTTAPTDVAPNSLLDILGCGWDSSDTTLQIYAAGSANAKVNTGITVTRTASAAQVFELAMFASPNGSDVTIQVTDLTSGTVFSTVISAVANLPSNTTALNVYGYNSAGGTSSSISIELMSLYVETNY